MGMVIELPLATFDDWQSLPVRKGNIQGVVKELLSLGHEDGMIRFMIICILSFFLLRVHEREY